MTDPDPDRGDFDPFAPKPLPPPTTGPIERPSPTRPPRAAVAAGSDDLEDLKKQDLMDIAETHGLDTTGTKNELVTRIRRARNR